MSDIYEFLYFSFNNISQSYKISQIYIYILMLREINLVSQEPYTHVTIYSQSYELTTLAQKINTPQQNKNSIQIKHA